MPEPSPIPVLTGTNEEPDPLFNAASCTIRPLFDAPAEAAGNPGGLARSKREIEIERREEEIRRAGYDDGFAEGEARGREKGHQAGLAEGAAARDSEIEAAVDGCAQLTAALESGRLSIEETARKNAIQLALGIAKRIVAISVETEEALVARLSEALDAVDPGESQPVVVRTAASQLDIFRALPLAAELQVSFEADPDLSPGDLIVQCGTRGANAIVREQLARLEEVLGEG